MASTTKVVVTGASGLLGRAVLAAFASNPAYQVVGTAFSRAEPPLVKLDLTDFEHVKAFMAAERPAIVVHCAAERRPDVAARDEAGTLRLNVDATRNLAEQTEAVGAWLVYISTDYVFDGTAPPYSVTDTPNPLNFYGKTKLGGEKAVESVSRTATILRVPVLYGSVTTASESAVNVLLDVIRAGKRADMDHHQSRFPTNVSDVARAIVGLAGVRDAAGGILHFSAKERMTKYDMCKVIAKAYGLDMSHLVPITDAPVDPIATRPQDAQLSTARLDALISITCVPFADWFNAYAGQA
ncbi:dTDP-4-dehydrorhamnose reductase [Entophlyctis helioformis]|nr:dTDP-4-dehydrorhamnose reductase [Entophlyctis helioformis]